MAGTMGDVDGATSLSGILVGISLPFLGVTVTGTHGNGAEPWQSGWQTIRQSTHKYTVVISCFTSI